MITVRGQQLIGEGYDRAHLLHIAEVDFRQAPGLDLRQSGHAVRSYHPQ